MNTIQTTITGEPVTGFQRIAQHENFVILPDLNMVQQVRVITVDEHGNPLCATIEADETLSHPQKQAILQRYADQIVSRQTAGAFVDRTGQIVDPAIEGAIPQREYFQSITLGDLKTMGIPVSDQTPVATLIYTLIQQEITNLDNRKAL